MQEKTLSEILSTDGVRMTAVAALGVLTLFLAVQTFTLVGGLDRSGVPATDTITVTGDGQATVAPDVALVSFSVENKAATVAVAQEATTKQTNAALALVKEQGVADKDVKTLSYTISPQYSYPTPCAGGMMCPAYSEPKITGYSVSQTVQVKVRELAKVGDLLSGLGKLGVQNVSGPNFTLDDATAGTTAARADAIAKAKAQAELLSKQLGVHLGKIVNFSESTGGRAYPMAYAMGGADMMSAKMEAPSIPAGENTYSSSVSITYEIR